MHYLIGFILGFIAGGLFARLLLHPYRFLYIPQDTITSTVSTPLAAQPKGKTQFLESVSDQEKFNNATSVGDLLDGE